MARRREKDAPMESEHRRSLRDVARLQALKLTGLMDPLPEASYDRFVRLASRLTGPPKAFLSLVDDRRQFLKATHGEENPARETPLTHALNESDTPELTHRDGSRHRFSHRVAPFGEGQRLGVATRLE